MHSPHSAPTAPEIPADSRDGVDALISRLASMDPTRSYGVEASARLQTSISAVEAQLGVEPGFNAGVGEIDPRAAVEAIEKTLADRLPFFDAWARDTSLPVASRLTAAESAKKIRAALAHDLPPHLRVR